MSSAIDAALNPALGKPRLGERPLSNREYMQRTAALCAMSSPAPKCTGNVFVGMFFDGTGNNEDEDFGPPGKPKTPRQQKHSNVVRLLHAHPNNVVIGSNGYYRYYIPGLGTPFKEIGDSGWLDEALGSSAGRKGAARVVWGLTRIFNAISQYVYNEDFIKEPYAAVIANDANLPLPSVASAYIRHTRLKDHFQTQLKAKIAGRNPKVDLITVNVFGFSRGAAEARAFVNWLFEICEQKDGGWLFAGIPLRVQFLGIFDSVASVGVAGVYEFSEGRIGWADNNMQVHPAVERCVHMVAAHEVRGCFPLDSARVEGKYPPNVVEYVYPGSHSDVGGGYIAQCLGKNDWEASASLPDRQLARVPGYEMYCVARAAGVPFLGFEELGAFKALDAKLVKALKPAPATVRAFDSYCEKAGIMPGPVEEMARQHMSLYFTHRWRIGANMGARPEMRRAMSRPNSGKDYASEASWMTDTQVALIYVIAGLCTEIGHRIRKGGTGDKALHQLLDAHAWVTRAGVTVPAFGVAVLGMFAGTAVNGLAERRRLLTDRDAEAFMKTAEVARRAPEYLRRWREFLANGHQADVRDTAVERDGVRLLEALQTATLEPEVVGFFDTLVHDSMAGFIGMHMAEFQVNGYGIAKFRRIFFGDKGDAMLRREVARRNKASIAAADKRRADRARWDAESRAYARTRS